MKILEKAISSLIPYEFNNKIHTSKQIDHIANSIKEFWFTQPIVIDKNNVVIIWHWRLEWAKKLWMDKVPVVIMDNLTENQIKKLRILDNKLNESEWDVDNLKLEMEQLWDLNFWDIELSADDLFVDLNFEEKPSKYRDNFWDRPWELLKRFIAPPFSVLDTRKWYWTSRKKQWLEITGDLSETRDWEFWTIWGSKNNNNLMSMINNGTSNFDPVLAECMYKWFCPVGWKIIDPFGWEQTKWVVAGELWYNYYACEFRQDQVDLNKEKTKQYKNVHYYCGDSNNIDKIIVEDGFDLCFTSPPYYDLEVYSKEDMSALWTYEEFMKQYKNIFTKCYNKMNDHSFLVVKVGEIRDKNSWIYRWFVPDNIKIMEEIGFKFYNEIILVNSFWTAAIRANNSMRNRKIVKVHQNVLVFYKWNLNDIPKYYESLDFNDLEDEIDEVA